MKQPEPHFERNRRTAEEDGRMKNYKLTMAYDGTRYFGWEHQPNTELTIQGKLETVLARMMDSDPPEVIGAGRTDAGVHARAMVANVRLDTSLTAEEIRDYMNRYLPEDIRICHHGRRVPERDS